MPATNFTPIQLYRSTTTSQVPSAGNLSDGELAINTADQKLFFKNSGGVVKLLASPAGVTTIADGVSVTIDADTTFVAAQANTQAVGTLTINAPTGTPTNGQRLVFRLRSTNIQTFSFNAIFQGSTDLGLPTASSGGGAYDYMGFIYNSTATKWQLIAKVFGF